MEHKMQILNSYDRITRTSNKSRNAQTTIGWRTRCSCGAIAETNSNNLKAHRIKVQKHLEAVA